MIAIDGVRGHLTHGDAGALCGLSAGLPKGALIAEVGSYAGLSAITMAAANPGVRVLAHDTWTGNPGWRVEETATKSEFASNVERLGFADVIRGVEGDSVESARLYPPGKFQMIFIDGDHSLDGVRRDLQAWWHLLSPGGVFAGHDCVAGHDVDLATRVFCKEMNLKRVVLPFTHGIFRLTPA